MKKIILFTLVSLLGLLVTSASLHANEEGEMKHVDNSMFEKQVRPPAVFEHDAHNDAADIQDCAACHHLFEEGVLIEDESSEDQSCEECHRLDPSARIQPLMKVFHKRCKGCHLEKKIGPILCGECHKRKGAK